MEEEEEECLHELTNYHLNYMDGLCHEYEVVTCFRANGMEQTEIDLGAVEQTRCCAATSSSIGTEVINGECHSVVNTICYLTPEADSEGLGTAELMTDMGFRDPRLCDLCLAETASISIGLVDGGCYEIEDKRCLLENDEIYESTEVLSEVDPRLCNYN